jgi:hypothetical protein
MDSGKWRTLEQKTYYENKKNVEELINLCGNTGYKITYTYIALRDPKKDKSHSYFIFSPFVSAKEKMWEENKIKPWDRSYAFDTYSVQESFVFIKDDYMIVPLEFYKEIHKTRRDICILEYDNYFLKFLEYTFVGNKPVLYSVEYSDELITDSFEDWYAKLELVTTKVVLKFSNTMKEMLPFPVKDIMLTLKNNGTFFEITKIHD